MECAGICEGYKTRSKDSIFNPFISSIIHTTADSDANSNLNPGYRPLRRLSLHICKAEYPSLNSLPDLQITIWFRVLETTRWKENSILCSYFGQAPGVDAEKFPPCCTGLIPLS